MSNPKEKKGGAIGGAFEEDPLGQISERQILARLWTYMRPHAALFLFCLLLLPVMSGLQLIQPHLLQIAIDDYLIPKNLDGIEWLFGVFVAAVVFQAATQFLQFYFMQLAGQRALRQLRQDVFEHVQTRASNFFHRQPTGRLMARMTTDVESLQEAISAGIVTMLGDFFTLAMIVIILLSKSWKLALVSFIVVPILVGLTSVFRYFLRRAFRKIRVKIARLYAHLQESITGMSVIQLFVRERVSAGEYDEINNDYKTANYEAIRFDALLYSLVEMVGSVTVGIIIWYGSGQVLEDIVTLGVLVAFIEYMQKFFIPIRDLAQKYNVLLSAMASAERIFQLLDQDEAISDEGTEPVPEEPLVLKFENVWFAYADEDWILRDVSFEVRPGEKIAIVGHTGSGKTTITRLALRLYEPTKGRITINGKDIREYDLRNYRESYAVVLQDVFLFTGSVAENIRLWNPKISDELVKESAQHVYAHRVIEKFDDGYDHEVKERGSNLSAGERQLIAFARALAHQPEFLILDEATANVDTETEHLVQQAVERLLERQTSLAIAHRLSTIQNSDRILVLDGGELLETGSHDELVAKDGHYAELYRLQFSKSEAAE